LRPGAEHRSALHQLPCDHGDPDSFWTPVLHELDLDLPT
jgi:hypothetical protein